MNTNEIISILETLVINVKTNCDTEEMEKQLIRDAANSIIQSNHIELDFDDARKKIYSNNLFDGVF